MFQLLLSKRRSFETTHMTVASCGGAPAHDDVRKIRSDGESDHVAATKESQQASPILKADELQSCELMRSSVMFGQEYVVVGDWNPVCQAAREPFAAGYVIDLRTKLCAYFTPIS